MRNGPKFGAAGKKYPFKGPLHLTCLQKALTEHSPSSSAPRVDAFSMSAASV